MQEHDFKVGDIVEVNLEKNANTMGIIAAMQQGVDYSVSSAFYLLILSDPVYNIGYGRGITWAVSSRVKKTIRMLTEPWWENRLADAYDGKVIDNLTYIECLARLKEYAK